MTHSGPRAAAQAAKIGDCRTNGPVSHPVMRIQHLELLEILIPLTL